MLCRDFAAREIRPISQAVDEADIEMPWEIWWKAAGLGLTSYMLPEELGGGGLTDVFTQALVQEELCFGCSGIGNLITSNGFAAKPILVLGSEEQQRRWVEPMTGEQPTLGALAITEPGVGSDAAAIQTTATRTEGGYVLRGQKSWISSAGPASTYVVFATVEPGSRAKGITAFVVEKDDQGFTIGPPVRKMGQRARERVEVLHDLLLAQLLDFHGAKANAGVFERGHDGVEVIAVAHQDRALALSRLHQFEHALRFAVPVRKGLEGRPTIRRGFVERH